MCIEIGHWYYVNNTALSIVSYKNVTMLCENYGMYEYIWMLADVETSYCKKTLSGSLKLPCYHYLLV